MSEHVCFIVFCPNHEGAFDCTPFCRICEGEQVCCVSELTSV